MRVSVHGDTPESPALTVLEQAVLHEVVQAAGDASASLEAQVASAEVASRTSSGVGFVTRLKLTGGAAAVPSALQLPVVKGSHPSIPGGAEFMVELKDGQLHTVEAFCFSGMWPDNDEQFTLTIAP